MTAPTHIEVRGARVNNLKNIDVDVPLGELVAIAGVSGSGKSSLALGVLYAEGSRRYIEALSTYTRRRLSQAARAHVDSVTHVPAALALRQRPGVPNVRSTFGTSTELLNVLRIMISRLGSHPCPNGHMHEPTFAVAAGEMLTCAVCGVTFAPPGAEEFAFNSGGACTRCQGTGMVRDIDVATLVPDESLSIMQGAVLPWNMFGLSVMPQVVAEMGVRVDVPYRELTPHERDIVMNGPAEKRHITAPSKSGKLFEMNFTYRNATAAVREAMNNAKSEKGLARITKFITEQQCPICHGTRLSEHARASLLDGKNLAERTAETLDALSSWVPTLPATLPSDMREMANMIVDQFQQIARRLLELGLGYLTLERASLTLSTGERQRVQLSRAVRNETTGVLYVLDEPSIGLHPANIVGLIRVMRDLISDGNSVVFVDHDTQVLQEADWLIEIGPGSGVEGGTVLTAGTIPQISASPASLIGPFLAGTEPTRVRPVSPNVFAQGEISVQTTAVHTVKPLDVSFPKGRLTAVTGMSGSGKTTLVLDSLVSALQAQAAGSALPSHVSAVYADGVTRVDTVDATPIGINVRSTVATYSGVLDALRKVYAATDMSRAAGLSAGDFSYNTGSLRCERCEGTGEIVLDVQFLPDVNIPCPVCNGARYSPHAFEFTIPCADGVDRALPDVLALPVREAAVALHNVGTVHRKLRTLDELGLGYLLVGESTPALSGGESQRLKLATELGRDQSNALFVLDEPTVGLHPLDIRTLIGVIDRLLERGATVIVIEHDLDLIANADYIVDMGPGGGAAGGEVVASGTVADICENPASVTGRFLADFVN